MNETFLFTKDFLIALSNWQKGWREDQTKRRELADKLVEVCKNLPEKFKRCDKVCFRKRFIIGNEIVPIVLENDFFEGIASWSLDINFTKEFKGLVSPSTNFAMLFKQKPKPQDIIVNICELWQDEDFKKAVNNLEIQDSLPLLNFKDYQSEVVLRSNLRGIEIEHIVGISSSFDDICNMGNIPQEGREELSIRYARNPDGISISMPVFASNNATKKAVTKTINKMKNLINEAKKNNIPIYNLIYESHKDDLKHKVY